MELNIEHPGNFPFVRSADAHRVVIADRTYTASLILARDKVIDAWGVSDVAALDEAGVAPILDLQPDVVLLGTGGHQAFPSQAVLGAFLQRGIGVEAMDNAAAARTWDILAGEGRNVVVGFIVCDRP